VLDGLEAWLDIPRLTALEAMLDECPHRAGALLPMATVAELGESPRTHFFSGATQIRAAEALLEQLPGLMPNDVRPWREPG
jgi:hypothetical protein